MKTASISMEFLAAVTLKGGLNKAVDWVLLETCTDAPRFLKYVQVLLDDGILTICDIFVVNKCTIHIYGDKIRMQGTLFQQYGVLIITLSQCHLDYNPT